VNLIKNMNVEPDDFLVTFDIVSLFTKIPIDEEIQVVNKISDQCIAKLVETCLKFMFFSFQGQLYEQTCGVAMGFPLSLVVANLFMEHFE